MSENYITREEVETLLKEHSMKLKAEIESNIRADQKENSSEIIKKIDELKLEIKDTQKKTDDRLTKLEKTDIERKTKLEFIKEKADEYKATLDSISAKLDRCITCDNLEEKLPKYIKDLTDSVNDLKNRPDKEKAGLFDKIGWTIAAAVIAGVVGYVLNGLW